MQQIELSKDRLIDLYVTERKSVNEIANELNCSQGKINYWLQQHGIAKRTISEAIYQKHNPTGDPFCIKTPKTSEEHYLYGLGVGLYWGEGTKRNLNSIRLGNTDPALIRKFLEFLTYFYNIPPAKIHFGLQIFSDMSPEDALSFWQHYLRISRNQFWKVIVTPSRGVGNYRQKTKHGVLTIYVSNVKLRNLLCLEIEKLQEIG